MTCRDLVRVASLGGTGDCLFGFFGALCVQAGAHTTRDPTTRVRLLVTTTSGKREERERVGDRYVGHMMNLMKIGGLPATASITTTGPVSLPTPESTPLPAYKDG